MPVTKQVALANETYKRLRQNRRTNESFSQAIDRLLDGDAKDPMRFVRERTRPVPRISADERIRLIEEDRNRSWVKA